MTVTACAVAVACVVVGVFMTHPASKPKASALDLDVPQPDTSQMQPRVVQRIRWAHDAVVREPTSAGAWGRYGAVCAAHVLLDSAAKLYRKAIQLAPGDFRWVYLMGLVRKAQGADPSDVIELFTLAAKLSPDYAPIQSRLGELLAEQGRVTAARQAYLKALALGPDSAFAHFGLGQLALRSGDARDAVTHFERAAQLLPDNPCIEAGLARSYARVGETERAAQASIQSTGCVYGVELKDPLYDELLAFTANSLSASDRAASLMKAGQWSRAIPFLKIHLTAQPRDPLCHAMLALAYLRTSQPTPAEQHFSQAMRYRKALIRAEQQAMPLPKARKSLNTLLVDFWTEYLDRATRGDDRTTLEYTLRTVAETTDPLDLDAEAYLSWGNALLKLGDTAGAIARYEKAIRVEPGYAKAHSNLGVVLESTGRWDEALEAYDRATKLDPNDPAAEHLVALRERMAKAGKGVTDYRSKEHP